VERAGWFEIRGITMSWIWNFFAGFGRLGRTDSPEQARLAELRRKREQGRKGNTSDGYSSSSWGQDDNSPGSQDSWGVDTSFSGGTGGANTPDNGPFGAPDTSYGDSGGGDFGGGSDGGGGDGGGGGGD